MKRIEKLCIVDDDDIFQFLTQNIIEATKLVDQIKIFSSGMEAIDFLRSKQGEPEELPEIILLDLNMPVMDGWDFLEEYITLRPKLGKEIYIYVVTSSINPTDMERARQISAVTDFIVKPVTKDKFIELMKGL